MTRSRFVAVAVTLFALIQTLPAAAERRRPAKIIGVTLAGHVLDATDSSAVFGAKVRIQDKTFLADAEGRYEAVGLQPGEASLSVERWGYETATRTITLQAGANSQEFRLTPRPVIQLTDSTGTAYRVDFDSAFFATQAPLSSVVPLSPAEFCRQDGSVVPFTKEGLSRITGSGQTTEGGVCCPGGGPGVMVSVTPKGAAAFEAIMQECRFYSYLFVSRDRATGTWLYLDFKRIREITFP